MSSEIIAMLRSLNTLIIAQQASFSALVSVIDEQLPGVAEDTKQRIYGFINHTDPKMTELIEAYCTLADMIETGD